ncbi:peptide MFS transporter [Planctomycetota bacterium]
MAKEKHPRGLISLFFTEMWERFGFYTMMAVFVLYMTKTLGWDTVRAGWVYGLFNGAVYILTIGGGAIADRWLGQARTIKLGGLLMALGHALFWYSAPDRIWPFYAGLVSIGFGSGLLKANISVLVGNLYKKGSALKDTGFNIFYMGINIGAFVAPLTATGLNFLADSMGTKEMVDGVEVITPAFNSYNASFGIAAIGMLIGLVIFQLTRKTYESADVINKLKAKEQDDYKHEKPIDPTEQDQIPSAPEEVMDSSEFWQRIAALGALFLISVCFWAVFYQNGSSLTLFAENCTDLGSWLKAETFQTFNPLFIVILTPVLLGFFRLLEKQGRDLNVATKICLGCIMAGLSPLLMVFACLKGGNDDLPIMSPWWLVGTYFLFTIAEILFSPMGLSFVSKVAPPRIRGMMMGFWFGSVGVGAQLSGIFAAFWDKWAHHNFFIVMTCLLFFSAFLVLIFMRLLKKFAK